MGSILMQTQDVALPGRAVTKIAAAGVSSARRGFAWCQSGLKSAMISTGRIAARSSWRGRQGRPLSLATSQQNWSRGCRTAHVPFLVFSCLPSWRLARQSRKKFLMSIRHLRLNPCLPENTSNHLRRVGAETSPRLAPRLAVEHAVVAPGSRHELRSMFAFDFESRLRYLFSCNKHGIERNKCLRYRKSSVLSPWREFWPLARRRHPSPLPPSRPITSMARPSLRPVAPAIRQSVRPIPIGCRPVSQKAVAPAPSRLAHSLPPTCRSVVRSMKTTGSLGGGRGTLPPSPDLIGAASVASARSAAASLSRGRSC